MYKIQSNVLLIFYFHCSSYAWLALSSICSVHLVNIPVLTSMCDAFSNNSAERTEHSSSFWRKNSAYCSSLVSNSHESPKNF